MKIDLSQWRLENTGRKDSIRIGDLWAGHLYLDDVSPEVDTDAVRELVNALPLFVKYFTDHFDEYPNPELEEILKDII